MRSDGNFIIRVRGQDDESVHFRINNSTKLEKVLNAYCKKQQLDVTAFVLLLDGRRIQGEDTPEELGLKEGSEISAMLHQTGGGA